MLTRANRVVTASDYKSAVRRGRRRNADSFVLYTRDRGDEEVARFGFIIAKSVGNAVTRNLVRRRLKGIAFEQLEYVPAGVDIVVRALPAASQVPWSTLRDQLVSALTKGGKRG